MNTSTQVLLLMVFLPLLGCMAMGGAEAEQDSVAGELTNVELSDNFTDRDIRTGGKKDAGRETQNADDQDMVPPEFDMSGMELGEMAPLDYGHCTAPLKPGDLIITELMVRPHGERPMRQWIEVYNLAPEPLCLTDLRIVATGDSTANIDVQWKDPIPVEEGHFASLGGEEARGFTDWTWKSDEQLPMHEGTITIFSDTTIIDTITFGKPNQHVIPMPREGESLFLCKEHFTPSGNNLASHWSTVSACLPPHCISMGTQDEFGNQGTPNDANPACNL